MLIFYGGLVAITVIVGEHLRSRIFERVLRSKSQRSHFELDQKLIYDALSDSDIPPQNASHIARRAFDIAFSFCGLWVMAPILIVVACIIKLESPRERVFFISQRRDVFGTSVRIIKFRTVGRDGHETRVGRQLRLSSLDEVPQFFVVLGGSMTLIGPRPLLNSPTVDQETRNLAKRYHIKPGLVDLAFWQGLKSSAYIAYTLNYAKQRTILSDIGIVWQTVVGARGLLRI
jgi:lipopolysaccharide/colanic/teichoic acid biosynthesis glycosyltransferase